jgi:hypothetical protein
MYRLVIHNKLNTKSASGWSCCIDTYNVFRKDYFTTTFSKSTATYPQPGDLITLPERKILDISKLHIAAIS